MSSLPSFLTMFFGGRQIQLLVGASRYGWGLTVISGMEFYFHWWVLDRLREWVAGESEPYAFTSWVDPKADGSSTTLIVARFPDSVFVGLVADETDIPGMVYDGGPMAWDDLDRILAKLREDEEAVLASGETPIRD